MTAIRKLGERIQIHYGAFVWSWIAFWALLTTLICLSAGWITMWAMAAVFAGGILAWEILLRAILFAAYGRHFRYSFLNYLMVDHPTYGYCMRPGAQCRQIGFPIFDRCAFPPKSPRLLDPAENRAARVEMNINSRGYRGREFDPDKKGARMRIFCSGGSTTFCPCGDDDQAWPAVLEARLRSEGLDIEVINAGALGWHSYPERLRFEKEIIHQRADVVLIHQGWNEEFQFSSLSLGKKWSPTMTRNVREAYNLYCAPNRFYSSTALLGVYLFIQHLLKKYVFVPNMNFRNPARWRVLLRDEYIAAWVDNLLAMAAAAEAGGIMLYTLDVPGLVGMADAREERKIYIENTRLTSLYADYQAFSRQRIIQVLGAIAPVIPRLDLEPDFRDHRGMDRMALYYDEIHLTPRGNAILGERLAGHLLRDEAFLSRYREGTPKTNVRPGSVRPESVRREAAFIPPLLFDFVKRFEQAESAPGKRSEGAVREIPADRYTTW